ncbi:MAG TPA: hypothetical protein VK157_14410 [Phycisphaerales bacterium]|nr:hypothetical protein [Phycisphaerales bacterium]
MRPYFVAVFSLFAAAAGLAQNVCEQQARWTPTQIATPLSLTTSDVAVASDGTAFVAGTFQTATTTSGANVLARWTGAEWDLVPGSPANIQGIVKHPLGGVIVWGNFTSAGDVPVSYVARWNGQVWSAVGSGLTAAPFEVHTGSSVVMALTASGIMGLGAGGWTPLPASTISFVQAIAVGPQDSVVAAGAAGAQFTPTVARFNGTTWNELPGFGSVLTGSIGSFNSVGVTSDGNVYASWEFAFLTPASATIGYWNGNSWSYRSATPVREFVPMFSGQMASISSGSKVNGALTNIGYYWSTSRLTQGVAESLSFNEFVYAPGDPTPPFSLNGIAQLPDGRLMVAGNIPAIGGAATDDVAVFGVSWNAAIDPGSAINGTVHDFLRLSPSDTLVVGALRSAGAQTTRNIATWNGTTFARENDAPPLESALCVIMSPTSNPVVGGVGSDTYTRVGGAWTRMGSGDLSIYNGSGGSRDGTVYALAYRQNGTLVAAGDFGYGAPPFGGGRNFGNVAQLIAGQWSFMAQGVPYTVYSLLRLPSGDILAGGAEIRRWNGTAWSSFATLAPAGSSVRVMRLLSNGDLVVGGDFTAINGVAARSIARWNGTT